MTPLQDMLTCVCLISGAVERRREDAGAGSHCGLLSRESMVSISKALAWVARMGDWELDVAEALQKELRG